MMREECGSPMAAMVEITAVPSQHLAVSETLSRRPQMSSWRNWSRMMWQSVVDRAIRILTSGPF
ncbi:hypothetical protein KIN20_019486 [Parelaphostrongylus tenuis]|uniref:Uncharacterized protein n=1 Tax=Parelaphostrongylus tenuis TaxID=148309 RepID=A0AAD5ML29_PARTN|nr:hypothetical protein KIN20_019486 [Parelaphostrongylus tenuis]